MTVKTISNKHLGDVYYPLEKIQYLSRTMMMVDSSDFDMTDSKNLHFDFFLIINKYAKEAHKKLREIENGNATD